MYRSAVCYSGHAAPKGVSDDTEMNSKSWLLILHPWHCSKGPLAGWSIIHSSIHLFTSWFHYIFLLLRWEILPRAFFEPWSVFLTAACYQYHKCCHLLRARPVYKDCITPDSHTKCCHPLPCWPSKTRFYHPSRKHRLYHVVYCRVGKAVFCWDDLWKARLNLISTVKNKCFLSWKKNRFAFRSIMCINVCQRIERWLLH